PSLADRIAVHEAGHVLTAHLLGCPLEAIALSARAALGQTVFRGQSAPGALFVDPVSAAQAEGGSVPREALDRYCIVVMAGVAAEAEIFGRAEGGLADERALRAMLGRAGFADADVRAAAVWGAANAALLIRDHRESFDRLRAAFGDERVDVAAAVQAMEGVRR
ncbi:hypothetical protein T492DRAFT_591819, partial [Pavlovales sp. CCMP2436]